MTVLEDMGETVTPFYADLLAKVESWTKRQDVDGALPSSIQMVETFLNKKLRTRHNSKRVELPYVSGSDLIPLPEDWIGLRHLAFEDCDFEYLSPEQFDSCGGDPVCNYYTIIGDYLRVKPTKDLVVRSYTALEAVKVTGFPGLVNDAWEIPRATLSITWTDSNDYGAQDGDVIEWEAPEYIVKIVERGFPNDEGRFSETIRYETIAAGEKLSYYQHMDPHDNIQYVIMTVTVGKSVDGVDVTSTSSEVIFSNLYEWPGGRTPVPGDEIFVTYWSATSGAAEIPGDVEVSTMPVIDLIYYHRMVALTLDPPDQNYRFVNQVYNRYPALYFAGVMSQLSDFYFDDGRKQKWESRFQAEVDSLIDADLEERWSGSTMQMRAG